MQIQRPLKLVLTTDALSCLAMGSLLAIGSAPLARMFGLPATLLLGAGLALLPIGIFILWTAARRSVAPLFVWAIVAGNTLWTVESLLLARSADAITGLGTAFVLLQAAMVAALTCAEAALTLRARNLPAPRAA